VVPGPDDHGEAEFLAGVLAEPGMQERITAGVMQELDVRARQPKRTRGKGEQCGHRNWGRYCGGCGQSIGKDGYPA